MGAVRTAPRPFLTVKEVMILLGCKEDFAYKTMRKINKESESQGYISIGSGKVNKHLFADKLQIPEEDIEQAIQYVAAQEALSKMHIEHQKLDGGNKGNDVVRMWAEKVLQNRRDSDG